MVRLLLAPLFLFLIDAQAWARGLSGDEGRIENARWSIVGNVVVISYELLADHNKAYEVRIVLRRQSDRGFRIVPKTVSGAIGEGKFVGAGREIRWDYRKDVTGLYGDDYYFEIVAEEVGSNLLLYLSGVAILGGVAYWKRDAIVDWIVGKKVSKLPDPPTDRPPGQ